MLTVTNLSIRTKQTKETLVRSVSFSVKSGEALGLIGESGSGKSMTSKCIMRLLNPRLFDLRGSVQWNGKELCCFTFCTFLQFGYLRYISMITYLITYGHYHFH